MLPIMNPSNMNVFTRVLQIRTAGFNDVHDLTDSVEKAASASKISNGLVTVFVPGSTAAVTTIEFESGAIEDLKRAIERIVPQSLEYAHDDRWGDGNGFAHIRAALLGPSISIPYRDGTLGLGTWQQIVLIDFDNRPRSRDVTVQVIGI
jgi:secondary thiamine-phosphate synthase enzyme